jgi:hypothetical protein
MLVVFFVSALMHEVAVGVPLRMLRGWAFLGMFLQVNSHQSSSNGEWVGGRHGWS